MGTVEAKAPLQFADRLGPVSLNSLVYTHFLVALTGHALMWIDACQPESMLAKSVTRFRVRIRSACSQAAHGNFSDHMQDARNPKSNILAVNWHAYRHSELNCDSCRRIAEEPTEGSYYIMVSSVTGASAEHYARLRRHDGTLKMTYSRSLNFCHV